MEPTADCQQRPDAIEEAVGFLRQATEAAPFGDPLTRVPFAAWESIAGVMVGFRDDPCRFTGHTWKTHVIPSTPDQPPGEWARRCEAYGAEKTD